MYPFVQNFWPPPTLAHWRSYTPNTHTFIHIPPHTYILIPLHTPYHTHTRVTHKYIPAYTHHTYTYTLHTPYMHMPPTYTHTIYHTQTHTTYTPYTMHPYTFHNTHITHIQTHPRTYQTPTNRIH